MNEQEKKEIYAKRANLLVHMKEQRYRSLTKSQKERYYPIDVAYLGNSRRGNVSVFMHVEVIDGKLKFVFCDQKNIPICYFEEGKGMNNSLEYADKSLIDEIEQLCNDYFEKLQEVQKEPKEQDMNSLSFILNKLDEKDRERYNVKPDKVKEIKDKQISKQENKKENKEEKDETQKEEMSKLENLKGKVYPHEAVPLSQLVQEKTLCSLLKLKEKMEDRLPDGVTIEEIENGYLSRVNAGMLNEATKGSIGINLNDAFVIETKDGKVIPLPEGILEPMPKNENIIDQKGLFKAQDSSQKHAPQYKSMYKIVDPAIGSEEDYFITTFNTGVNQNGQPTEERRIGFTQAPKGQEKNQIEGAVTTELYKEPQRTKENLYVRESLRRYSKNEATEILKEHEEICQHRDDEEHFEGYNANKFELTVKMCMKNPEINEKLNDRDVRKLVSDYLSKNPEASSEEIQKSIVEETKDLRVLGDSGNAKRPM